uniref:Uncharacterized protein n=1 Tax=Siphoviridae sp. ctKNZ79 TaxID=2825440 RepID=A0A8S5U9I3_9CAUD|nr:MAG TPA: hypothetical protein [Siphoviridae sp. ctKNZ79]
MCGVVSLNCPYYITHVCNCQEENDIFKRFLWDFFRMVDALEARYDRVRR